MNQKILSVKRFDIACPEEKIFEVKVLKINELHIHQISHRKVIRHWIYDQFFLARHGIYLTGDEKAYWDAAYNSYGMIDCKIWFSLRTVGDNTIHRQMTFNGDQAETSGKSSIKENFKDLECMPSILMSDRELDQLNMKEILICKEGQSAVLLEPERLSLKYRRMTILRQAQTIAFCQTLEPIVAVAKELQNSGVI